MTETSWLWVGCFGTALGSAGLFLLGHRRTQDEEGHTLLGNNGIQAIGALLTTAVITVLDLAAEVGYGVLASRAATGSPTMTGQRCRRTVAPQHRGRAQRRLRAGTGRTARPAARRRGQRSVPPVG